MHISSNTKALLPEGRYHTESRGVVWVKVYITKICMYLLNNIKDVWQLAFQTAHKRVTLH